MAVAPGQLIALGKAVTIGRADHQNPVKKQNNSASCNKNYNPVFIFSLFLSYLCHLFSISSTTYNSYTDILIFDQEHCADLHIQRLQLEITSPRFLFGEIIAIIKSLLDYLVTSRKKRRNCNMLSAQMKFAPFHRFYDYVNNSILNQCYVVNITLLIRYKPKKYLCTAVAV